MIVNRSTSEPSSGRRVDYRIPKMIKLSDTSGSADCDVPSEERWISLHSQWDIIWYAHFTEPITDEFNNYPKRVFRFVNNRSRSDILIGIDDAKYLFKGSDKGRQVNRFASRLEGIKRGAKVHYPIQTHNRLFFNLATSDFEEKALRVLKNIPSSYVLGISTRLASLLFLRDFLSDGEKMKLGEAIDFLDKPNWDEISPELLNFVVYKPLESGMNYKELEKHFPHLQVQIDKEHKTLLDKERERRGLDMLNTNFGIWEASDQRELDSCIGRMEKELQKNCRLTFLDVFEREYRYRTKYAT